MLHLRSLLPAALITLGAVLTSGHAAADEAQAQTFVEREHGNIRKLVERKAPSVDLKKAIDAMVDYDELTRRALGKPCPVGVDACTNHWDSLTEAQREKIKNLLQQLVVKNYTKNLNQTVKYKITYRGSKSSGQNLAKVRTEAKNDEKPRDAAVEVEYLIMNDNKVVDIVTERSSMTKNYYDQFHKMLTTPAQGYEYLVSKLQKNLDKP